MARYTEVNYTIAMERDWKIAYGPKGYAFAIKREDNSDVCTLFNGLTPQDKALAQLISAAPDMLAALEACVKLLREDGTTTQKALAAIAKAKGAANA